MKIEKSFKNICLIGKKPDNHPEDLKQLFPNDKICVCDFYVSGSEAGDLDKNNVTTYDDILIIDHHMPVPQMMRDITSTEIACNYVNEHGALTENYLIIINHTDTDSILSASIMAGLIPPHEIFIEAARAADHSGEENVLSDLLQSLEDDRNLEDSIDMLLKVWSQRISKRSQLKNLVSSGKVQWLDDIAFIEVPEKIDSALLPSLLPDAKAFLIASKMPEDSEKKWRIRIRLGSQTKGISLNELELPDFGGRWNAGSTARDGGTDIEPQTYVEILHKAINNAGK
ncbi:MAG: hypothetical protein KKA84_16500 [Bacteroidetes bacterium]|nr:hypothetical protein [Bacteroidota bacterium]